MYGFLGSGGMNKDLASSTVRKMDCFVGSLLTFFFLVCFLFLMVSNRWLIVMYINNTISSFEAPDMILSRKCQPISR